MEPEYTTEYGKVPVSELVRYYEMHKRMLDRIAAKKNEYNQTEEGKQKNREHAKQYYEKNREKILEKRKIKYQAKKDTYQMD